MNRMQACVTNHAGCRKANCRSIGKDVDDGMVAVECDNPRLKGALRKNCGRADLGKHRLGELIAKIPHNDRWSTNTEGQRRLRDHR